MPSPPGGKKNNWRSPSGRLARALIHEIKILHPTYGEKELARKFIYLWPSYQKYFLHPVTPHIIKDRWDKGVRQDTPTMSYSNEHPDKNPETKKYLPFAKEIVAKDAPITDNDINDITWKVTKVIAENTPEYSDELYTPEQVKEQVLSPTESNGVHHFYIASDHSDKCKPGNSKDAYKRIMNFRTPNPNMRIAFLFIGQESECKKLESILKDDWENMRDGENYGMSAMTMRHIACATIVRNQIVLWETKVKEH
jgi:hypothetical protein